jgi:hypothetical protein
MCFSADGDLAGGVVVFAIGVDALRHLRGRKEYLVIAALPLVLGLHQIDEAFVWWGLQGHVSAHVGRVAMWIYLLFALVALPVLAPVLVMTLEKTPTGRRRIAPFLVIGMGTSVLLLVAMLSTTPSSHLGHFHIAYSIGLRDGIPIIGLYIIATCGSMLASGFRHVVWFGFANLVAVVVLARLCADGFTSLWCFYAALASGGIALYLRIDDTKRDSDARSSAVITG